MLSHKTSAIQLNNKKKGKQGKFNLISLQGTNPDVFKDTDP